MSDDEAVRQWREIAPDAVLLDGFHALKHALRFGADVRLVVTSDKPGFVRLAADLAPDLANVIGETLVEVPGHVLRDLVPRVHPTAVAALAAVPAESDDPFRTPRRSPTVILDNPRNLGNVGAVVRLAAGLDATGVITIGDLDPWHPNVVRASAGLHFATAVRRLPLTSLPPGPLYALDPDGTDIRSTTIPDNALLAFGSERHGLSPRLRAQADHLLALPMHPQVSSYNLATSVAMTLYHWTSHQPD